MLKAVIMAGGNGTRLWPISQPHFPKQFISMLDQESMLQKTVKRLAKFLQPEDIYVVTLAKYAQYVYEQIDLPRHQIIIEPENRDTAACIGLSAIHFLRNKQNPVLITIPADHYVEGEQAFQDALITAYHQARKTPCIVTLGIKPSRPETGYGYMKVQEGMQTEIMRVERFTEKPDLMTASKWIKDSGYYWNSGIFVWRASLIQDLISEHMPSLAEHLMKIQHALGTNEEMAIIDQEYKEMDKVSMDFGVLEKARCLYMLPVSFVWDDMGSWSSLSRVIEPDENGNVIVGKHRVLDTRNCIIYSEKISVATMGLENLIITVTDDTILICPKNREQEIRKFSLKSDST